MTTSGSPMPEPVRRQRPGKPEGAVIMLAVVALAAVMVVTACGAHQGGPGAPRTAGTPAGPLTASQASCLAGLNAAKSLNAPLASHDAVSTASVAQSAASRLTPEVDAPSGAISDAVRGALAAEAGAIDAVGEAAQTVEYGNGQYTWSLMSSYVAQLASAVQVLSTACRPARAAGPPHSASGCPSSARLLAVWNATPARVRRSWTPLTPSGFFAISCWQGWIVSNPVINANGPVVFYQQGGLHLLPETDLRRFDAAVCSSPDSPAGWQGPAGPAVCSPAQPVTQPTAPPPEHPGFASALSIWKQSHNVAAAFCSSFVSRAAEDLRAAGDSRYAAAIKALENLAAIPDTGVTAAQVAQSRADRVALNRFFGTPGLQPNC